MGKELFKPQTKGSLAQIALVCLALLAPIHSAWAQQAGTVDPTDDPLDVKDSKPYTDRTARVSGNGVITQRLNYTEQRMIDLAEAPDDAAIKEQIGDRCVEYFRVKYGGNGGTVDDTVVANKVKADSEAWNYCREKVLGEYASQIGRDQTYDLENKSVAKGLISTTAKTVGVTPSAAESKESSILPPLLTFGQVAHIYEGMDPAKLQARTFNDNFKKYGVASEGFVKTEEVPDDPENPSGSKHLRVLTLPDGSPQFDRPGYEKAIRDAKAAIAGQPAPANLKTASAPDLRLTHTAEDDQAEYRWQVAHHLGRGNPNGKNPTRIKAAYSYKDLDGQTRDTLSAHRNTFNRSRYELLQATNKAIAKSVGRGGFGTSARGGTPKSSHLDAQNRLHPPSGAQRGPATAEAAQKEATQEDANLHANDHIEVPQGANAQLGQFSIGYSDSGLKKMMDDAVGDVLSAP